MVKPAGDCTLELAQYCRSTPQSTHDGHLLSAQRRATGVCRLPVDEALVVPQC
jgi:hypothetical protein